MGRPSKLTPATTRTIIETIEAGNYFDTACAAAGVTRTTGYTWLDRGKTERERIEAGITDTQRQTEGIPPAAEERRYLDFADAVAAARARAEVKIVKFIHKDIEGGYVKEKRKDPETGEVVTVLAAPNGRLGLEWLARVHARRFGRRQTIEVSGPEGGPVQVDASDGARLAQRLSDFLANVRDDPRIVEARVTARRDELITAPPMIESGTGADDDAR